ncbi:hypothetical protein ACFY6U_12805 [Streptomyces sp. NPDC013157]|uniref:hypothetical protein n=1 Tax=Streptomyces sp. NPDC013157 TaxID=3364861 RepID=UPI0036AF31D8
MTDILTAAPVPPIGAHPMLLFLLQVGVLLSLAIVPGRLAVRLGLPPIVGELSAGVLLGPHWSAGPPPPRPAGCCPGSRSRCTFSTRSGRSRCCCWWG